MSVITVLDCSQLMASFVVDLFVQVLLVQIATNGDTSNRFLPLPQLGGNSILIHVCLSVC